MFYCLFSYAGTWELVNLFVGTKNFSYHTCYEKKQNRSQETDHGQTELNNMLVNKSVLNEIDKKEHSRKVSRTEGRLKGKYLKI